MRNPSWIESLRKLPAQDLEAALSLVDDALVAQALSKILEPLQPHETESGRIGGLLDAFRDQADLRNLIAGAMTRLDDALPAGDLESALRRLKEGSLKTRAVHLQERIRQAEAGGDSRASEALLLELAELRRQRTQA